MAAYFNTCTARDVKSMDAIFFVNVKDTLFSCSCGWIGSELELDVLTHLPQNLVCCPVCQNDDVRVLNEIK